MGSPLPYHIIEDGATPERAQVLLGATWMKLSVGDVVRESVHPRVLYGDGKQIYAEHLPAPVGEVDGDGARAATHVDERGFGVQPAELADGLARRLDDADVAGKEGLRGDLEQLVADLLLHVQRARDVLQLAAVQVQGG